MLHFLRWLYDEFQPKIVSTIQSTENEGNRLLLENVVGARIVVLNHEQLQMKSTHFVEEEERSTTHFDSDQNKISRFLFLLVLFPQNLPRHHHH